MKAIEVDTVVQPGGRIEVRSDLLHPGSPAHVTIEQKDNADQRCVADWLKEFPGHRLFRSAEEVDEYLARERDSWDR